MDELHGRLLWTTLPSTGDFTDCGVIVLVDYPFLGNSVQTALIAMDDSLDEQEMGLSFCFPITTYFKNLTICIVCFFTFLTQMSIFVLIRCYLLHDL